jgi:hypothetical protein
LANVRVRAERAENIQEHSEVVTLRAVERFSQILPVSARIVAGSGRLAVLLSELQLIEVQGIMGETWAPEPPVYFPDSSRRLLWIARHR